jgi:hypothetical protein
MDWTGLEMLIDLMCLYLCCVCVLLFFWLSVSARFVDL